MDGAKQIPQGLLSKEPNLIVQDADQSSRVSFYLCCAMHLRLANHGCQLGDSRAGRGGACHGGLKIPALVLLRQLLQEESE